MIDVDNFIKVSPAIITTIAIIVQLIKGLGVPKDLIPHIAVLIGLPFGVYKFGFNFLGIFIGALFGLASSGAFSNVKAFFQKETIQSFIEFFKK